MERYLPATRALCMTFFYYINLISLLFCAFKLSNGSLSMMKVGISTFLHQLKIYKSCQVVYQDGLECSVAGGIRIMCCCMSCGKGWIWIRKKGFRVFSGKLELVRVS